MSLCVCCFLTAKGQQILPRLSVWVEVEAADPKLPAASVGKLLPGVLTRRSSAPLTSSNSERQQNMRTVLQKTRFSSDTASF